MIAVAGGKGGSGKTTTTVGVARSLARRDDRPVVAIDADWDLPNLVRLAAAATDEPGSPRVASAAAVARGGGIEASPGAITAVEPPADPADRDPDRILRAVADAVADGSAGRPNPAVRSDHDARSDHGVRSDHDARSDHGSRTEGPIALVDCPAGAGPDAAAPLRVADACLLVTPLRVPALRDAAKTAAMARALDCPPIGVVAARAEAAPSGVSELLGCPVLGAVPNAPPDPLATGPVRTAYDAVADRLVAPSGGPAAGAARDGR